MRHGEVDGETRRLIAASGLFDAGYYRDAYGHLPGVTEDPLGHFLAAGLAMGHAASASFDPVLYRVLVPDCGDGNPLLHCIASARPFGQPALADVFPGAVSAARVANRGPDLQIEENRAYAPHAARERSMPFAVAGRSYSLGVPDPRRFMSRIAEQRPFAVARLAEGYWEGLWIARRCERILADDQRTRDLRPAQRRALSLRLASAVYPRSGNFAPSFLDEMEADIRGHREDPDFARAVSFKGYPTFDEQLAGRRKIPPLEAVLRIFSEHMAPGAVLFDATLWKRLLIAGHLAELPRLVRDRPLVVVGAAYLAPLGSRWETRDFIHVEIAPSHSQYRRYDLLGRVRSALETVRARGAGLPVVLTQCGAALAHWLIVRLRRQAPDATYLDVGQAINGWFLDARPFKGSPWMRIYARSIVENAGLQSYYRATRGADYTSWIDSLA